MFPAAVWKTRLIIFRKADALWLECKHEALTVFPYGTDTQCYLQILRGNDAPSSPSSHQSVCGVLHQQQPGHTFLQFSRGKCRWGRTRLHQLLCVHQNRLLHWIPNHTSWPGPRRNQFRESACELYGGKHAPHPGGNHSHPSRLPYCLWGSIFEPQAQS